MKGLPHGVSQPLTPALAPQPCLHRKSRRQWGEGAQGFRLPIVLTHTPQRGLHCHQHCHIDTRLLHFMAGFSSVNDEPDRVPSIGIPGESA